jgi:hypothetical protein
MEKLETLYNRLISEDLEKRDYSRPYAEVGIRIENIMPPHFEAYVKVMNPWYLNVDAPEKYFMPKPYDELWPDIFDEYLVKLHSKEDKTDYQAAIKEIVEKNKPYEEEEKAYRASIDPFLPINWKEITWKEVCTIYESHYHNELSLIGFDYKYKGFIYGLREPQEHMTPTRQSLAIVEVLKKHTKTEVLFWDSKGFQAAFIDDFAKTEAANSLWGYITTRKCEWMYYTTHEYFFAVIGGSYALIDDLLNSDLEVLECNLLTRIDYHSDTINR